MTWRALNLQAAASCLQSKKTCYLNMALAKNKAYVRGWRRGDEARWILVLARFLLAAKVALVARAAANREKRVNIDFGDSLTSVFV
jgi:hypothetical protein